MRWQKISHFYVARKKLSQFVRIYPIEDALGSLNTVFDVLDGLNPFFDLFEYDGTIHSTQFNTFLMTRTMRTLTAVAYATFHYGNRGIFQEQKDKKALSIIKKLT